MSSKTASNRASKSSEKPPEPGPVKDENPQQEGSQEVVVTTFQADGAPTSTGPASEAGSDQCDSEHLLMRDTYSFRCLAQVLMSNSSLMRHPLYHFPPLKMPDPSIDETFDFVEPPPSYDETGAGKYKDLSKEFGIVPISRIIQTLDQPELNLKYYGLTPKQTSALAEALKGNTFVERVILQDNWFDFEQSKLIGQVMEENGTMKVLNLKDCNIGPEGAECIGQALILSQFLEELDLSHNNLGDEGLLRLEKGLSENTSLKVLDISHNGLTEDSGEVLERILTANQGLEDLDLSWSGFYTGPGNKKLFNGLRANDRIKRLHFAWNALKDKPAVSPLVRYIRRSKSLEFVDLSSNQLSNGPLRTVRGAINRNHSLVTVKLGENPCTPEEAYFVATLLTSKPKDPLNVLDMEYIYFNKEVTPLIGKARTMGRTLTIGGILSNYTIKGPDINELLFKRCKYLLMKPKKKKKRKDFGIFVLQLPDQQIAPGDLEALLKKQKIKRLDKDLLAELTGRFTAKKKKIDCVALKAEYMRLYPETTLPPPKAKKKKGAKRKKKGKKKSGPDEETVLAVHDLEEKPSQSQDNDEKAEGSTHKVVGSNHQSFVDNKKSKSILIVDRKVSGSTNRAAAGSQTFVDNKKSKSIVFVDKKVSGSVNKI